MTRPPRHDGSADHSTCAHGAERRSGRPGAEWAVRSWVRDHSRRGLLVLGAAGIAAAVVAPLSAQADAYPSWKDVLKARANVKDKAQEIAKIKALLAKSRAAAEQAQRVAEVRGTAYQTAQARVETANERLATIEKQVAADQKRAEEAKQRAGQLAAQLSRTGGTDLETSLFFASSDSGGGAEDFLARLGRLSKLTESNGAIADEAAAAKNTAAATQAQMAEVKRELVSLKEKARLAYQAAVKASEDANAQVQREQAQQVELQALLDALEAKSDSVAKQYQAGVAAKKAAQLAGAGGAVTSGGWAKPAYGPITAGFGPRPDQPAGANYFHRGTDIGAGYGSPIYAAHAGTVVYAGWYGTYGNWIEIDNGGGISTGYAHIRPGGTFVRVGQQVSAGQNIASVGETGAATGPHLHFETRINEVAVNAVPFMAARGIGLG